MKYFICFIQNFSYSVEWAKLFSSNFNKKPLHKKGSLLITLEVYMHLFTQIVFWFHITTLRYINEKW